MTRAERTDRMNDKQDTVPRNEVACLALCVEVHSTEERGCLDFWQSKVLRNEAACCVLANERKTEDRPKDTIRMNDFVKQRGLLPLTLPLNILLHLYLWVMSLVFQQSLMKRLLSITIPHLEQTI